MQIRSLAFFEGGFKISYYPLFATGTTTNLHIKVGGHHLHHTRNLWLGHSGHGYSWSVHIYFPPIKYTRRSKDTLHLTDCQQEAWVNDVLLPSLRESCPEDVVDHHPPTFQEARLKMRAQEQGWRQNESNRSLNMHHVIPSEHLPAFWRSVQAHTRHHNQFRDLFLFCHAAG